ncbi:MAG: trimeric intracellular cation channel family protein [Oleiphilaceae bacterium]|nr:trimeric intracellular cation channel family protein [Oleiphilaceae bacterium]
MIYYLGMLGIAAFSITGVLAAGKKDMDIFSIVLLGIVTALGGGTLRDIILDVNPVFWINDINYLWVSLLASIIAFFMVSRLKRLLSWLLYVDALGLSLFTILATQKAVLLGFSNPVAVTMGLVTGIAGGMIRDVLTGRMPLLLGRDFYATPALLGAILYTVLLHYFPTHAYNSLYAIVVVFMLRAAAIQWGLYYPRWLIFREPH